MGYATSGAQLFTFTGKQFQHSVNLYYLGYRYLDPKLGRFVQMDPLLNQNPRDPQTANRYAYAKNNPLRFSDPDGRMAFILEGGYLLTPKSAGGVQGKLAAAVGASLEATGPTKPSALPSDRDDHTETTVTTVRTSTFSVPPDYTSESSGPSAETIVHTVVIVIELGFEIFATFFGIEIPGFRMPGILTGVCPAEVPCPGQPEESA